MAAASIVTLLVAPLAACSTSGYWAVRNATDLAIMEELRQDPWLVPVRTQSTYVALNVPPEYDSWIPGRTRSLGDQVDVPLPQVLEAQIAAASQAGWWPYHATCVEWRQDAFAAPADRVEVLLARKLSAGVLAQAELTVSEYTGGSGNEASTGVSATAEVPSHRDTQAPAPLTVDVRNLECIVEGGQESVGEPVDLLEDHR